MARVMPQSQSEVQNHAALMRVEDGSGCSEVDSLWTGG